MEKLKKATMVFIIIASLLFIFKTSIDVYEYYKPNKLLELEDVLK